MEYMTMVIRWRRVPQQHINFPTVGSGWYVSRWTHAEYVNQHLTVICAHLSSVDVQAYTLKLLNIMKKLWADPVLNLMAMGTFEALLTEEQPSSSIFNSYNVTRTEIQLGVSFYEHVMKTVAMVKECNWTKRNELTIADDKTMFKLSCRHVSAEYILSYIFVKRKEIKKFIYAISINSLIVSCHPDRNLTACSY